MRRLPMTVRVGGPMLLAGMALGLVVPLGEAPPGQPVTARPAAAAADPPARSGPARSQPSRPGGRDLGTPGGTRTLRLARPPIAAPLPLVPDCGSPGAAAGRDRTADPGSPGATAWPGSWWRMDPVLDEAGWLVGQELRLGRLERGHGARPWRSLMLPAESFASGPTRGRLLVGADDGELSQLLDVDLARGCLTVVAELGDIVRRAVMSPDATTVFEFRVGRDTREDLGVWRRDLADPAGTQLLLGPPTADPRFGPTWTTRLVPDPAGGRLAVESCGASACRHRIVDLATGGVVIHADPHAGALLGLGATSVYARAACPGLPCPILALDPDHGARVVIAAAGLAALSTGPDGERLVAEAADETQVLLIDPLDGRLLASIPVEPGRRVVAGADQAASGLELPPGPTDAWTAAVLAPDGRIDAGARIQLIDLRRAAAIDLEEVLP